MRSLFFLAAVLLSFHASVHAQSVMVGSHAVSSWRYQLQGRNGQPIDLAPLTATATDLVVIDYSANGTADGEFTSSQIAALKASGKVVLAYMSIGEAENYRFYWNSAWVKKGKRTASAPAWLAKVNPDWAGNFKVRYWSPEWQQIIFGHAEAGTSKSYVDRVLDAGFDGVYLDIIDAFETFGPDSSSRPERPTAAADMATFVESIAHYARTTRGRSGFLVVPQNGSNILTELSTDDRSAYLAAIDAIGAEDTFFYGARAMNNPWKPQKFTIECLTQFSDAGKPVLAIEYVNQTAKAGRFQKSARDRGWVPLISARALDRLLPQPQ